MLDFKLRYLSKIAQSEERVRILLQFRNDVAELKKLGLQISSRAGDIVAGSIPLTNLAQLSEHPSVIYVEATRALKDETDVSAIDINLIDPVTGRRAIPGRGRGGLIGIIDSGFDLTHPCFRAPFPLENTRILAAWVQTTTAAGRAPHGFDYGIEYTQEEIDQAAAANQILTNGGGHGTSVAGIAAGNGRPDGIFKGMAPEAELILVTYKNDVPIGGSAFVLDAIKYIEGFATALARPVVINLSQGDDLGPHDGTSLLERAIDHVVSSGRTLIVKSAGNGSHRPARCHANGQVKSASRFLLPFDLLPTMEIPVDGDTIELWYRRGDRFSVALKTPSGYMSDFVPAGESTVLRFLPDTRAYVYSDLRHPINGDNHIGIIFRPGGHWEPGRWGLILRGDRITSGEFHAWADRPNAPTIVTFKRHQSDATTVTIPGNAHKVIAVGGFVSRPTEGGDTGEVKGTPGPGSSIGPTRDGRMKPDITAPSSLISTSRTRKRDCDDRYSFRAGTSMAAPHVTGGIALLWALWPELTFDVIRSALLNTAREDQFTGVTPNSRWGHGKLDIGAAYEFIKSKTESETGSMSKKRTCEFQVTIYPTRGRARVVTVQIDVENDQVVGIRGLNSRGKNVYDVSFSIQTVSPKGGDECFECSVRPCPPNRWIQVPCP